VKPAVPTPKEAKMDDKSYSETEANNVTAPDPPPGALVVAATNGPGATDANKFTGCYFVVTGSGNNTAWTLYNKGGHAIDSGTGNPSGFGFNHDKQNPNNPNSPDIAWTLSGCVWTATQITGSWSANDGIDPTAGVQSDPTGGVQSGSFTASSGGAMDAVSASA
jgi:hypothetical protein